MATLRSAAQWVLEDARDGIQWIVLYKEGRSWETGTFSIDFSEHEGTAILDDPDDLETLQSILAIDHHAIIVNSYIHNLGVWDGYVTRDDLAAALRWQYELQNAALANFLERIVQNEQPTEPHAGEIATTAICKVDNETVETKSWEQETRTVTLTNSQWNRLVCYLHASYNHRTGERDAWQELAQKKNPDGTPVHKNAAANAEYWQSVIDDLDAMVPNLDGTEV